MLSSTKAVARLFLAVLSLTAAAAVADLFSRGPDSQVGSVWVAARKLPKKDVIMWSILLGIWAFSTLGAFLGGLRSRRRSSLPPISSPLSAAGNSLFGQPGQFLAGIRISGSIPDFKLPSGENIIEGVCNDVPPDGEFLAAMTSRAGAWYYQGRFEQITDRSWKWTCTLNQDRVELHVGVANARHRELREAYIARGMATKDWVAVTREEALNNFRPEHTITVVVDRKQQ